MNAVAAVASLAPAASVLSEPLTWAEICERYPNQHVCLIDIDRIHRGSFEFHTARVASCGRTRREALAQVWPWDRYPEIGRYFTGSASTPLVRPSVILDDEVRDIIRGRR